MIGDRHIFVVRHQRIVGPEHPPGIGGVKDRGEEIGEVADRHWQPDFRLRHRRELLPELAHLRDRRSSRATAPAASADHACGPSDMR